MKTQLKQLYDNIDQGKRLVGLYFESNNSVRTKITISSEPGDELTDKIINLIKIANEK